MPPLLSCAHSLQLWHLLLVLSAVPPPGAWSLRSRGPAAPRPLCARRSPSALRPICIWDRTSPTERDSRFAPPRQRALAPRGAELRHGARLRRQAAGARPATPSGFEDGMPSSQYPWAIVWGPTVSDEDGGDTNSANPGFPPLGYTFVSPHGMATAQPNSHSLLHNAGLNLRETPATLRPFLFGPRGEGKSALCFFRSPVPAGAANSAELPRAPAGPPLAMCSLGSGAGAHHSPIFPSVPQVWTPSSTSPSPSPSSLSWSLPASSSSSGEWDSGWWRRADGRGGACGRVGPHRRTVGLGPL